MGFRVGGWGLGFRIFGLRAVDGANVESACLSSAPMFAVFLG